MPVPDTTTPGRRRFFFRLPRPAWIFLATVVLSVVAVGLIIGVPMYRQEAAIREIKRIGGSVRQVNGGPDWLRNLIGDEAVWPFDEVRLIALTDTQATHALVELVENLTSLEVLWSNDTQLTDAALESVKRLPHLRMLSFGNTRVTDAGLSHLNKLTNLTNLRLDNTNVTDAGIACRWTR